MRNSGTQGKDKRNGGFDIKCVKTLFFLLCRIIITEASSDTSVENAVRYYGASTSTGFKYGSQIPMSLRLISQTNVNTKPSEYKSLIEEWISKMPKGDKLNANWVVSDSC